MYKKAKYLAAGDKGMVIEFGNSISKEINRKLRSMVLALENSDTPGIIEVVPTYRSLLITYDPLVWKFAELAAHLEELENKLASLTIPNPRIILLPVVYGGEYGPDLPFVCEHSGLTQAEVIKIHTGTNYLIYMLGFTPGFPYLGGMDQRIATPRLKNPRTKIPGGSVGIAGSQTGVYPLESPGGWQLIGRTPLRLFDPEQHQPALLQAGDYVRFYQVTEEEYQTLLQQVKEGTYTVETREYTGEE